MSERTRYSFSVRSISTCRLVRHDLPRLLADGLLVAASLVMDALGRSLTTDLDLALTLQFVVAAACIACGVNYIFGLYHRIWRYASAGEVIVIAAAVACSSIGWGLMDLVWPVQRPVPLSVVVASSLFTFMGFVGMRYRRRILTGFEWRWRALRGDFQLVRTRVLIVGAGEDGQLLAWRFLNQFPGERYEVIGFIDDDPSKLGMRLHGIKILGDRHVIPGLVERERIDLVLIALYNIAGDDFRAILDICERTSAIIKVLPNVFELIEDPRAPVLMRDITAADLLGRKSVEIDQAACRDLLSGKAVLVTGAAGSIGSQLCRQIIGFGPRHLIMVDNNESGLHDLFIACSCSGAQQFGARPIGMHASGSSGVIVQSLIPIVGDVTNESKMQAVMETYRPQIVFHAAAYKHVPLMEEHPDEALRVNVLGTHVMSDLATRYGVERFVLVSTDKAINPSSIMGATKRLCEILIMPDMPPRNYGANGSGPFPLPRARNQVSRDHNQPLSSSHPALAGSPTDRRPLFTAVRFGNVLSSRGSVVPTFERQIDEGGPITVTHPEMTRYFMSIPEAASLIIQSAALTENGDIFMLNMGQRIRIDDLARRLIRLRGLRPEVDIPIVYTGVRPGEKMHEELLGVDELRLPTTHPKIFRIQCAMSKDSFALRRQIEELLALTHERRYEDAVALLRETVGLCGNDVSLGTAGSAD
ncbi:MAG: polysaccharide biosynthesis protein [Chloroflexota bacterium]|nr:MAG: polysaccharide biosynthesis protein [Chloroflexota bacterium]